MLKKKICRCWKNTDSKRIPAAATNQQALCMKKSRDGANLPNSSLNEKTSEVKSLPSRPHRSIMESAHASLGQGNKKVLDIYSLVMTFQCLGNIQLIFLEKLWCFFIFPQSKTIFWEIFMWYFLRNIIIEIYLKKHIKLYFFRNNYSKNKYREWKPMWSTWGNLWFIRWRNFNRKSTRVYQSFRKKANLQARFNVFGAWNVD